jgi:hypothetical protein
MVITRNQSTSLFGWKERLPFFLRMVSVFLRLCRGTVSKIPWSGDPAQRPILPSNGRKESAWFDHRGTISAIMDPPSQCVRPLQRRTAPVSPVAMIA